MMQEVAQYIQTSLAVGAHSLTIADIAHIFSIGESKLRKDFKASYGITVRAYIIHQRMERAKYLLQKKEYSIKEIAAMSGYEELSNFSRDFKMHMGQGPRKYKRSSPDGAIC